MVLLGAIGVFLLVSLSLVIVRALPVSTDIEEVVEENSGVTAAMAVAPEVGPISDYQVINEKPVFNVTRLPLAVDDDADESVDDDTIAVKDAPEVKLTGVIITPGLRMASLKPIEGNLDNVMAREGEALTGEYVGWQVSTVSPRNGVLESRDGQKLKRELQVHDAKIEEPPKPAKPAQAAQAGKGREQAQDEDGQPLSRAEQIRQRIAERREELRREQEEQQYQSQAEGQTQADGSTGAKKMPGDGRGGRISEKRSLQGKGV